jgi:hypothetical protein
MPHLFDDPSALHNFKQQHGFNVTNANTIQPYLEECAFRRQLNEKLDGIGIQEASRQSGLNTYLIRELVDSKVLDLGVRALREAKAILEQEGLAECLKYLLDA